MSHCKYQMVECKSGRVAQKWSSASQICEYMVLNINILRSNTMRLLKLKKLWVVRIWSLRLHHYYICMCRRSVKICDMRFRSNCRLDLVFALLINNCEKQKIFNIRRTSVYVNWLHHILFYMKRCANCFFEPVKINVVYNYISTLV